MQMIHVGRRGGGWRSSGTWLSGYSYRKSFTYSRPSGAVSNYQVKILVCESDGVNMLSNPGFEDGTGYWDNVYCTDKTVIGGQSGNCLQITRTSEDYQAEFQNVTLVPGQRYITTAYTKSGTSGNETALLMATSQTYAWDETDSVTTSDSWQQMSVEFTAESSDGRIVLRKVSATEGDMLFDTVTLRPKASCEGHCLSTFNDLRFTDSDGNELDYWIEETTGTTPNQVATVWVELDSVGTSSTTFYMYYGKADASAASNIANTFIIGDDFERGSNEDAVGGDWTVVSGSVIISTEQKYGGTRSAKFVGGAANQQINTSLTASDNIAIRLRIYKTADAQLYPCSFYNGTKRTQIQFDSGEDINYYDTEYRDTGANVTAATWGLLEIRNISFSGGTYDILYNDVSVKTGAGMGTSSTYTDVLRILGGNEGEGCDSYVDNVIVRHWRSTEPALGSWGEEEAA